jgi:CRISPR-associated protein Csx10
LFGTRRPQIGSGERAFSGLVLGDGFLVGTPRWATRSSVAIDRARRSASDKQLVFLRIPESAGHLLTFVTTGRVNESVLAPYLEVAARATTHIGSGRSRGLARVELELAWQEPDVPAPPASRGAIESDLRVRVTLTSPALVGVATIDANYRETRRELPGSTVRGAIGFALRELLENADGDPAAQDLLDAERGARFGFLYPADAERRGVDPGDGPVPITSAACKRKQRAHGIVDTLLDRLVLLHASSAAGAERASPQAIPQCRECGAPLRGAQGSRRATAPPKTRLIVRASMDRTRQSARDGQLFTQVLLAPGSVFEGTIRNIPLQSRQRLSEALGSGIVSFGRGRSSGWGQAKIDIEAAPRRSPLAERAAAFDRALRARLDRAGLASGRIGRLVPVTLLSPLWPSGAGEPGGDGKHDLCDAMGSATCLLAARRFAREGSWDQRSGMMTSFRATAAGGVFVIELQQATWRDIVGRLETLERDGIGQRRDQGHGQVLCFDPHFVINQQNG